jgi:hypothetical protein
VVGVISTLLAAPTATGAGLVVVWGLLGRNYSDVGVPMYEHEGIAHAAGLGVLCLLAASLLVLIHNFARSHAITLFGVIWMLVWFPIFLFGLFVLSF